MGKKYTTDEIHIGGHELDAAMMVNLNTVVSDHTTYLTSLPSHTHDDRYVQEGGTSFNGVYPMVVRVGTRSIYSDADITFTGSTSQLYVGGSIKAPIFYDSDNTGYFLNPAGTSLLNGLEVDGDIDMRAQVGLWITSDVMSDAIGWNTNYGVYIGSNVGGTHYLRGNGTFTTGGSTYNLWHAGNDGSGSGLDADTLDGQQPSQAGGGNRILQYASNGYLYNNNWIHPANGTGLFYDAGVHFHETGNYMYSNTGLQAANDMRAPIFYDRDNTGYYLNPAGSSRLGYAHFDGYSDSSGNARTSTGVSLGRYTSEYAHIDIASSHGSGGWIDFSDTTSEDYGGRIRYYNSSEYMSFYSGGSNEEFRINSSYTTALGSSRAPVFYDSNDTGYYLNPASTSRLDKLTDIRGNYATHHIQSGSDFVDGTLVTTDIAANNTNGDSYIIEVTGKSYNSTSAPFNWIGQGYIYNNTIINHTAVSQTGIAPPYMKVFNHSDNKLAFWWPRWGYWNSFEVRVRRASGNSAAYNAVTAITNSTEPSSTKKVQTDIVKVWTENTLTNNNQLTNGAGYITGNYLPLSGGTLTGTIYANGGIHMGNTNLTNVNHITINDPGSGEGIEWLGGNGWKIFESNDSNSNGLGNLQFSVGSVHKFRVDTSGHTTSIGSSRAPIFYDSDNTGYYLNPASSSKSAHLRGHVEIINESPILKLNDFTATNTTNQLGYISYQQNGTETGWIGFGSGSNSYFSVKNNSGIVSIDGTYTLHNASSRAPIFYDSNNTGYYLNPASTSNLNTLNAVTINRNPVVTLSGDVTGNATMTNLGSINITTTVANDSHEHSYIKAGGNGPSTEDLNSVADSVAVGELSYRGYNSSSTNKPPANDNANGVITVGQHSGGYNAQVAFSSNGNMYWRDNPSSSNGSWRTIWDSGNDGAGSGLDADLLDGQHASAFAPVSHTHTWANINGETANSVNAWGGLRHQTNDGYIDFGPANSGHAHIYTDRSNFYLNKPLTVNGSSIINQNDIRAGVFYDINDTGYYLNPASTSLLNIVKAPVYNVAPGNDNGIGFWANQADYTIKMGNTQQDHGTVTDYSMHFNMGNTAGRGFTFGSSRTAVSASINALTGAAKFSGDVTWSGGSSANANTAYTHSQAAHAPANAEANVQSDWNATSGDALILNKPTIPTDHGDHDGLYLPIGGGTVTGDLTVNGKVTQAGSVGREEWGRIYAASNTTIATLITSDGSALPTGGAYRMTAHIPGTGTDQVSMAVFWNEDGTWYCNNTFAGGTSSNHIEFLISGGVPKIKTWHTSNYNIQVTHERLFLGETGTDNLRGYFGADSFLKWTESTNALVVPGTISASGYNDTNWNTAYNHSQATHAPTNAEANVQSDWNATSGDALILNKPTIPTNNNQLTNGAGYTTYSANQNVNTTDSPAFSNLYVSNAIFHTGDTNTYTQFHASDQWRVVTAGAERLEVNNSQVTVANSLQVNGSIYTSQYIYHTGDIDTYMRFPSNDTISWNTAGGERMRINSSGNVGIGTTAPSYKLHVAGTTYANGSTIGSSDLWLQDTSSTYSTELLMQNNTHTLGIDYQNNETLRFITRSGTVTVPITFQMRAGTITAANFILSSDERKKTKIADLTCDNVDVSWKSFEMKDNEGEYRTGVIAQELEQKHPEFVNTDDEGYKTVKYIDLLIAKIAELEARLEKLEK